MNDRLIRIGVTGSGFMGRTHVEAARRAPGAEIVAVAGGRRAPGLAGDYEIDCVETVEELIRRDDIDAIISSTPHHCHIDETLLAAECGKHMLVEKPMATAVEDCDRMIAATAERGLVLAVGYHQRFRESNLTVRKLVGSGAIGAVRCVQMAALFDIEALRSDEGFGGDWGWWKDPRSRGHILNSGPHNIDLCRWWLGEDIVSVVAHCGTFREENPNENTTMAMWGFADGAMASFWSSSVCPSPGFDGEDFRFRLMGDEGIIDAQPFGKIRVGRDGEWELAYQQPHVPLDDADAAFVSDGRMQAYTDQVQAFVDRINGRDSGCGTEADGRAGVAAIIAMLDSSETGQLIRL
ncbi:MAG: Gfo/Idh/MocA family oxidoreductase [Planctomycetaceae bacterium]|jgi:predicted dehydrogenase|nr:Gfo/Idh/MocA family oxidoreductase [Planctomycetaceae bacterium]